MSLQIPEQVVGAVLGPKAATLAEIKRYSGAHVDVAKNRTQNGLRTVIISGQASSFLLPPTHLFCVSRHQYIGMRPELVRLQEMMRTYMCSDMSET